MICKCQTFWLCPQDPFKKGWYFSPGKQMTFHHRLSGFWGSYSICWSGRLQSTNRSCWTAKSDKDYDFIPRLELRAASYVRLAKCNFMQVSFPTVSQVKMALKCCLVHLSTCVPWWQHDWGRFSASQSWCSESENIKCVTGKEHKR